MGYGFTVEAWGEYALFSRPELKVERVSYDCITPSAARGLLEAVFWKPAIRYVIDEIVVLNPIRFTNVRRNEVGAKILASDLRGVMMGGERQLYLAAHEQIAQRASMLLREVRYLISAHFELTERAGQTDTPEKFYNMILRRLRKGQNYHQPCFGAREFPANLRLVEEGEERPKGIEGERDLGLMLYDMDYSGAEITPGFFRARMKDGVLDLREVEVLK
ncbi:MAG: type I-C CRISPR-associated protein Cas5c [Christensenellaceae bacterium]|jgi:CRISPR-associated protein Cas5d|nr:type I-C CRISPR-associated protein Cas5c [Christensenellaceae bacterium]